MAPRWRQYGQIALLLISIWAMNSVISGEALFFWPIFPLGPWGLILASHTFFGGDDRRWHR